jgi:hypothetical protein
LDAFVGLITPVFTTTVGIRKGVTKWTKTTQPDTWTVTSTFTFNVLSLSGAYIPFAFVENAQGKTFQRFTSNFVLINSVPITADTQVPGVDLQCGDVNSLVSSKPDFVNLNCPGAVVTIIAIGTTINSPSITLIGAVANIEGGTFIVVVLVIGTPVLNLNQGASYTVTGTLTVTVAVLTIGGSGGGSFNINGAVANVLGVIANVLLNINGVGAILNVDGANSQIVINQGLEVVDGEINLKLVTIVVLAKTRSRFNRGKLNGLGKFHCGGNVAHLWNQIDVRIFIVIINIITRRSEMGDFERIANPNAPVAKLECCSKTCGTVGAEVNANTALQIPECGAAPLCNQCETVNTADFGALPNVATHYTGAGKVNFKDKSTLQYNSAISNVVSDAGFTADGAVYVIGAIATGNNRKITIVCNQAANADCGCAVITASKTENGGFSCVRDVVVNPSKLTITDSLTAGGTGLPGPAAPAAPTVATPTPPSVAAPIAPISSPRRGGCCSGGDIAGIVIGSVGGFLVIVAIIGGVIYFMSKKNAPLPQQYAADPYSPQPYYANPTPAYGFAPPNTPLAQAGYVPSYPGYGPYDKL